MEWAHARLRPTRRERRSGAPAGSRQQARGAHRAADQAPRSLEARRVRGFSKAVNLFTGYKLFSPQRRKGRKGRQGRMFRCVRNLRPQMEISSDKPIINPALVYFATFAPFR